MHQSRARGAVRALLTVVGLLAIAALPLVGCDCGSGGDSDGAVNTDATPKGGPCTTALDCEANYVCPPATGECTGNVMCMDDPECGPGAFCTGAGLCNRTGGGEECMKDMDCPLGQTCLGGQCGCGGSLYSADGIPPNMLIVLDRSGSMNDSLGGMGTKWEIAISAIADVLMTYGDQINFGLMLYPGLDQDCNSGMSCGPGAVFVDPAPLTETMINTFLAGASTCSFGTPTAEALQALIPYAGLEDPSRPNYILLITDGQSTCDDPIPEVTALINESPSVETFVVGFGSGVDPAELDAMAAAGGHALPGSPAYYEADSAISLTSAFGSIAGSVLSCAYTLSPTPPDPNLLFIYFDGALVATDPTDGWSYDAASGQLIFNGSACSALQSGGVNDLVISYGCPIG